MSLEDKEAELTTRWLALMASWHSSRGLTTCCGSRQYGPVLRNEVWACVETSTKEILCLPCMEDRLGRKLNIDDLEDVAWNDYRAAATGELVR